MAADPTALVGALVGLRIRLRNIDEHRRLGLPLYPWQTEDALAQIDRALGPAVPARAHADIPERKARVDALAPVLTLAE